MKDDKTRLYDRLSFIEACKRICQYEGKDMGGRIRFVNGVGKQWDPGLFVYEDDAIVISMYGPEDELEMEIERKENRNPVACIVKGELIRTHGEMVYLYEHVKNLEDALTAE